MELKRAFEHCKIIWKIENFILLSSTPREFSCNFEVEGECKTLWRMTLNPWCMNEDDRITSLKIKRRTSNVEPDTVFIDYKIRVKDSTGTLYTCVTDEALLEKECDHQTNLLATNMLIDKLKLLEDDALTLECLLMVIFQGHIAELMPNSTNILFNEVSRDLFQLYQEGKISDVFLRFPGSPTPKYIRAHKAVLYYRNEVLARKIDNELEKGIIDFPELEYLAMDKALKYLYSGNVDYVMIEPSIVLYECISFLRLREVSILYHPNVVSINFSAKHESHRNVWAIKDFPTHKERLLNGGSYTSTPIQIPDIGITWEILLHTKVVNDEHKYLSIFASIIEVDKPYNFRVEIAILNAQKEKILSQYLLKDCSSSEATGLDEFVKLDALNDYILEDGSLLIQFTVKILLNDGINFVESMNYERTVDLSSFEEKLLRDMSRIYEEKAFADVSIVGKEYKEKVHKCILCARSFGFETQFSGKNEIELTEDHEPFSVLLCYVYGISREFCGAVYIPQLYHLATKYDFPFLAAECANLLFANLNVDNMLDILRYSHMYYNLKLKYAAIRFIVENFDHYTDVHMERFKEENEQLHFEIESFWNEKWIEYEIFILLTGDG